MSVLRFPSNSSRIFISRMAKLELISYSVALLMFTTFIYEEAIAHPVRRYYTRKNSCEKRCDKVCVRIRTWYPFRWECRAVDCGPLASPTGGFVATPNGTTLNENAVYSCISGYYMTGNPIRTCQADDQWSGTEPTCNLIVCGALLDPDNGQVDTSGGNTLASEALYQCDLGYVLSGPSSRLCKPNGTWTGSEPVCNAVDCGPLGNPCDGEVDISGGTQLNQQAVYSCQAGYALFGDANRTCLSSGLWSGTKPCCTWDCGSLSNPLSGTVSTLEGTLLGMQATYECNEGAHLTGDSTRTCQIGGWSGEEPQCRICPDEFQYFFDGTDSCYYIKNGTNWPPAGASNWLAAREACLNKSSKLAEVETEQEHLFLIDKLNEIGAGSSTDYYIGGRETEEGTWVWDSTNETITTFFWGIGRPFHDYNLSCLFMCDGCTGVQKFHWNDYFCNSYWRQYICELPAL